MGKIAAIVRIKIIDGLRHQDMYALWVGSHYFRTEGNFFQTKIFPLAVYLSCAHIIGFTELLLSNLMTTA